MRCLARRSTVADAIPGLTATNMTARMRAADGWRALRRGIALGLVAVLVSVALSACASSPGKAPGTASVVSAPVRTAHTRLGAIGYRVVGSGPPLVLIMGYGWTMEGWDPRLVHALARHNRVVMFDNSGVGRTQALPPPYTIDAMADQTSALIDTLGLGRPDVLGWSMGGMIAQALAVLHPAQVRRLVLCATYPGTGAAVVPSQAARRAGSDFPANQGHAVAAFKAAIAEYPAAPAASAAARGDQGLAVSNWWTGIDAAGREVTRISVPTLIADGTDDQLVPAANDHTLARLIPRARLVLYPDAGHAFLFQEPTRFASLVESFLAGHPSS
jgi:pimeloyl-ACP methyl ester carboxylesterase